jgi:hypothetical protein
MHISYGVHQMSIIHLSACFISETTSQISAKFWIRVYTKRCYPLSYKNREFKSLYYETAGQTLKAEHKNIGT